MRASLNPRCDSFRIERRAQPSCCTFPLGRHRVTVQRLGSGLLSQGAAENALVTIRPHAAGMRHRCGSGARFVSPRGAAERQIAATFVRAEPLVVPKRSLTNTAAERVDVRVMQVIYALPDSAREDFRVGQQIDAFIPARKAEQGQGS